MPAGGSYINLPNPTVLQRESRSRRQLEQCRSRLVVLGLVFCISYMLLVVRLFDVAFIPPETLDFGEEPMIDVSHAPRIRSDVLDRNGALLASSIHTRSLYANPQLVQRFGAREVAASLKQIIPELDEARLRQQLESERTFVYVKRHLTPQEQEQVNALGVPGLEFEEAESRIYPYGPLFAHVLGYVDVDNHGLSGIEKHFDGMLNLGKEPLTLSVDARVQHILREEMQAGMEEFQAVGAVGIVMDMHNGELIALSSLPDFDPNHPADYKPETRFNRPTYGVYEMGSSFKTFTTAMSLHYGTAQMQSGYDARHPIRVGGYTIRDAHPENRWLSLPEVFVHSSNIGTVRMVMEVGRERQQEFLKKLGLFERIKFELPEVAEPLIPRTWRDINMMTISYGHGISVTPLHLIRAIASLLGPGSLLQPTLVKNGNLLANEGEPIVDESIVQNLRKLMRAVVQHGTGRKADAKGYRVGGKTGTAEKVKAGSYAAKDKLASFVGVFPSEEPRYAILVMLDEPRGNKKTYGYATGGWVAAPVVEKVVSRMAPLYGIKPIYELPEEGIPEFREANHENERYPATSKQYVQTVSF